MSNRTNDNPGMTVRGISLIAISAYVKSKLDPKRLTEFYTRFPRGEPEMILTAQKGEWYPFKLQRHLREETVKEFNPRDPRQAIFDMVEVTANYEISTFLKAILGYLPAKLVLKKTADLWDKYYRPGKMELVKYDGNHAVFEVTEFSHDRLFCPTMDAWLAVAGKNMRMDEILVKETSCIHRGDELCRWEVTWLDN